MSCWAEKPEKRPPFETLRQDLDDFDVACEAKYDKYDEWKPNYRKDKGGGKKGGGGKRDEAMAKRKKKKKT